MIYTVSFEKLTPVGIKAVQDLFRNDADVRSAIRCSQAGWLVDSHLALEDMTMLLKSGLKTKFFVSSVAPEQYESHANARIRDWLNGRHFQYAPEPNDDVKHSVTALTKAMPRGDFVGLDATLGLIDQKMQEFAVSEKLKKFGIRLDQAKNILITGEAGTGKTSFAGTVALLLKSKIAPTKNLRVLSVSPDYPADDYKGRLAGYTRQLLDHCGDGILIFDGIDSVMEREFGHELIDTLNRHAQSSPNGPIIIATASRKGAGLMESDYPGFSSLFPDDLRARMPSYDDRALTQIFKKKAAAAGLDCSIEVIRELEPLMAETRKARGAKFAFGNEIKSIFASAAGSFASRLTRTNPGLAAGKPVAVSLSADQRALIPTDIPVFSSLNGNFNRREPQPHDPAKNPHQAKIYSFPKKLLPGESA